MKPEQMVRLGFSALAAHLAAWVGFGIHVIHHHNLVEHRGIALPGGTRLVAFVAPLAFLMPLAVLVFGFALRRRPLAVVACVDAGWLFAVLWPPTCVWAWLVPTILC